MHDTWGGYSPPTPPPQNDDSDNASTVVVPMSRGPTDGGFAPLPSGSQFESQVANPYRTPTRNVFLHARGRYAGGRSGRETKDISFSTRDGKLASHFSMVSVTGVHWMIGVVVTFINK